MDRPGKKRAQSREPLLPHFAAFGQFPSKSGRVLFSFMFARVRSFAAENENAVVTDNQSRSIRSDPSMLLLHVVRVHVL